MSDVLRRRGRLWWAVMAALVPIAVWGTQVGAAPPDDTFDLSTPGSDLSALDQGDVVAFEGTCWDETFGALEMAFVVLARRVPLGSGLEPFAISVDVPIDQVDGTFSGALTIPLDAPDGDYNLGLTCTLSDQAFAGPTSPAFVGEAVAPTTEGPTSSTASTVVAGPGPSGTTPDAPAADPVVAAAALTG